MNDALIAAEWIAANREALASTLSKALEDDIDIDAGITALVEAAQSDADETIDEPWRDASASIEAFFEAEGIVPEAWALIVEEGTSSEMRVFSGDTNITVAHFAGIMRYAIRRVEEVGGVEG